MPTNAFTHAIPQIEELLSSHEPRVFQTQDLRALLGQYRNTWNLPKSTKIGAFIDFLLEHSKLHRVALQSPYNSVTRYTYGDVTPFQIALSVIRGSYLSHGTAAHLHGLLPAMPNRLFVNKEQTEKPFTSHTLTQERIDTAFSRSQRTTTNIFRYENYEFLLISGKNTRQLEVNSIIGPEGESLPTTSLERTLIDIVVRPKYAGGVKNVLRAFQKAKSRLNVKNLFDVYTQLKYVYPYHQSIGFYLLIAGFNEQVISPFKELEIKYDFFLDYAMSDKLFHEDWHVYYPRDLLNTN